MFEVRCLVGDKQLAEVLQLLDGKTLEPPVTLPVKPQLAAATSLNGTSNGPEKKPWHTVPGGSVNLLRTFIKGKKQVTTRQIREHCEDSGYSKNGYSYALQQLLKEKALKKGKEKTSYEVLV